MTLDFYSILAIVTIISVIILGLTMEHPNAIAIIAGVTACITVSMLLVYTVSCLLFAEKAAIIISVIGGGMIAAVFLAVTIDKTIKYAIALICNEQE